MASHNHQDERAVKLEFESRVIVALESENPKAGIRSIVLETDAETLESATPALEFEPPGLESATSPEERRAELHRQIAWGFVRVARRFVANLESSFEIEDFASAIESFVQRVGSGPLPHAVLTELRKDDHHPTVTEEPAHPSPDDVTLKMSSLLIGGCLGKALGTTFVLRLLKDLGAFVAMPYAEVHVEVKSEKVISWIRALLLPEVELEGLSSGNEDIFRRYRSSVNLESLVPSRMLGSTDDSCLLIVLVDSIAGMPPIHKPHLPPPTIKDLPPGTRLLLPLLRHCLPLWASAPRSRSAQDVALLLVRLLWLCAAGSLSSRADACAVRDALRGPDGMRLIMHGVHLRLDESEDFVRLGGMAVASAFMRLLRTSCAKKPGEEQEESAVDFPELLESPAAKILRAAGLPLVCNPTLALSNSRIRALAQPKVLNNRLRGDNDLPQDGDSSSEFSAFTKIVNIRQCVERLRAPPPPSEVQDEVWDFGRNQISTDEKRETPTLRWHRIKSVLKSVPECVKRCPRSDVRANAFDLTLEILQVCDPIGEEGELQPLQVMAAASLISREPTLVVEEVCRKKLQESHLRQHLIFCDAIQSAVREFSCQSKNELQSVAHRLFFSLLNATILGRPNSRPDQTISGDSIRFVNPPPEQAESLPSLFADAASIETLALILETTGDRCPDVMGMARAAVEVSSALESPKITEAMTRSILLLLTSVAKLPPHLFLTALQDSDRLEDSLHRLEEAHGERPVGQLASFVAQSIRVAKAKRLMALLPKEAFSQQHADSS